MIYDHMKDSDAALDRHRADINKAFEIANQIDFRLRDLQEVVQ